MSQSTSEIESRLLATAGATEILGALEIFAEANDAEFALAFRSDGTIALTEAAGAKEAGAPEQTEVWAIQFETFEAAWDYIVGGEQRPAA
jgi:hypothetical protein